MRKFPYWTVGSVLIELAEDSNKYLSERENPIHISRPTFYKLEKNGIIPSLRDVSTIKKILSMGENKGIPWRIYNREEVNQIKVAIWKHYKGEALAKDYEQKILGTLEQ